MLEIPELQFICQGELCIGSGTSSCVLWADEGQVSHEKQEEPSKTCETML